jgi:predicted DNA-binding protein
MHYELDLDAETTQLIDELSKETGQTQQDYLKDKIGRVVRHDSQVKKSADYLLKKNAELYKRLAQ